MPLVYVTRAYRFCAGHRLHRADRDPQWNRSVYGKCSLPGGHGHNYRIEVTVSGNPDPETGWVMAPHRLDRIVEERVLEEFDHRNLNEVLRSEAGPCPTSEVVLLEIQRRLENALPPGIKLARLRLEETAKNSFEFPPPAPARPHPPGGKAS